VDHPLQPPDALVRPWRLAAFVAASIAAVELLLLLGIGGGALAGALSDRLQLEATERALAPVARPDKAKPAARKPAPVAASRVRSEGYRVGAVGNAARTDFSQSLVMFKPGFAGEGRRLARDLGVRRVGPLDGIRVRDLGKAHAVFILGA
jgi:hypothetical protein